MNSNNSNSNNSKPTNNNSNNSKPTNNNSNNSKPTNNNSNNSKTQSKRNANTLREIANRMNASGGRKMKAVGSRAEVWHGKARHTSGGLTKAKLMKNKHGRIVSKKQHERGKQLVKKLRKLGYVTKKGVFGVHKNGKKL